MKLLKWIFIFAAAVSYIAFFVSDLKEYDHLIVGSIFLIFLDLQEIKEKLDATQTN